MKLIFEKAPSNIYEAFYPISWVYSWHSFFPFTFIGDPKDGNLKTSGWNVFVFFFWVTLISVLLYINITAFSYDKFEGSTKLNQTANQFSVILSLLSALFVISYQMKKRLSVKKFFVTLNEFDDKVIERILFIY